MNRSRLVCALALGLLSLVAAGRGAAAYPGPDKINSASGQFIVSVTPQNSPFYRRPDAGTNAGLLRLDASLLAVSAERFKASLWRTLGLPADSPWSGKIFLVLHPARSTDEDVLIAAQPFIQTWNYRLELPDLITRNRCARAFSAVLLLEIANRTTPVNGRAAAAPTWLADGLARQIAESDPARVLLSAPTRTVDAVAVTRSGPAKIPDGLTMTRMNQDRRSIDPLAAARRVLQSDQALTFDQLSWPTGAQLNGDDGGVYLASAQLFVSNLLALKNGPAQLRDMLIRLPRCQNWQTAFFAAFGENFSSPLEVEKWWALRVVNFAAREPGPRWTVSISRDRLNAVLSVPVEVRNASNALPAHAEITLQAALQHFDPARQAEILETKLRDLDLIQLRLASPLAGVANGYRTAIREFLIAQKKRTSLRQKKAGAADLIKQLDALDEQRRAVEERLQRQLPSLPGQ